MKFCTVCLNLLEDIFFYKNMNTRCKECHRKNRRDDYSKNKEKVKQQVKLYDKDNPEIVKKRLLKYKNNPLNKDRFKRSKEKVNEAFNKRYYGDNKFRVLHTLRSRLRSVIRQQKLVKGSGIRKILGCDLDQLKIYLTEKFTEGMSWDNYGKWHMDLRT